MIGAAAEAARPGDAPALRLPDPGLLFDGRAARLAALASANPAPAWLRFLSRLAAGQALAVRDIAAGRTRAPAGGPPLAWAGLPRRDRWRRMLAVIACTFRGAELPAEARDALGRLSALSLAELDALAAAIIAGDVGRDRVALVPFAGAALQAWLSALAAGIDPAAVERARGACPVCAGPPLASVVEAGTRLRWVTCALCAAEWNVPRVQCVRCGAEHLEYLHAEGAPQGAPRTEAASPRGSDLDCGAKAEACAACRSYLKVFDEAYRPGVDAAADDAATLELDLLLAREGWRRAGANVYVTSRCGPG